MREAPDALRLSCPLFAAAALARVSPFTPLHQCTGLHRCTGESRFIRICSIEVSSNCSQNHTHISCYSCMFDFKIAWFERILLGVVCSDKSVSTFLLSQQSRVIGVKEPCPRQFAVVQYPVSMRLTWICLHICGLTFKLEPGVQKVGRAVALIWKLLRPVSTNHVSREVKTTSQSKQKLKILWNGNKCKSLQGTGRSWQTNDRQTQQSNVARSPSPTMVQTEDCLNRDLFFKRKKSVRNFELEIWP